MKSDSRTPMRSNSHDYSTPMKGKSEASTSYALFGTVQTPPGGSGSASWWSTGKSNSDLSDRGKGSPVDGVVQPGALITLPPPREVARPEIPRNHFPAGNNLDGEEWVTVYGFSPSDTNFVLREFEKCGVILKHIPGPRNANWMHILYQNRSDAQKALSKNGMQINGVLILGVKPVDPMQLQALNDKVNNQGFMPLPPSFGRTSEANTIKASPRPYYLQNGSTSAKHSSGAIASPAKSVVSKVMDLMFGV